MRVRRGAYVLASLWHQARPREKSLLRIAAVSSTRGFADLLSHHSAAAVLGIRTLSEDDRVHIVDPRARTTRTVSGLVIHAGSPDRHEALGLEPFRATGTARTAADLALTTPFRDGVAALDSALHQQETEDGREVLLAAVRREVDASERVHGQKTARRVLEFADHGAANPGESASRVVMAELGFASPRLQEPFDIGRGTNAFVDFWWERAGVVGEFDGFEKYSDPGMLNGRTPSDVVVAEKERESRLLADRRVRRVVRWTWDDVMHPDRLYRLLARAGVPR